MDRALIDTLKAFADPSRLRILGLLIERPRATSRLAEELGMAPRTVTHHLERLRSAGLVVAVPSGPLVEYALRGDSLRELGRRLGELENGTGTEDVASLPGPDGEPLPAFDARVLRAFIVDGRLESIPAQEKKRNVILRYLRDRCFPDDRDYPEKEVNALLAVYHPDVASLRRYMIDTNLMTRDAGLYRRST